MTTPAQRTAQPAIPPSQLEADLAELTERIEFTTQLIQRMREGIDGLVAFNNQAIIERARMMGHNPRILAQARRTPPAASNPLPAYPDLPDSQITADGDGHADRAGHELEASQIDFSEKV